VTRQVSLDRLRDISRQRSFGKRVAPATSADAPAEKAGEERVEWPISR
jgi:hypothetical protein